MADPAAALAETRRVLRPHGRLALAVWGARADNPWNSVVMDAFTHPGPADPARIDKAVCLQYAFAGANPFGHSGRRIGDFYAGLVGDFQKTQNWKRLRRTKHDHHPVHDALGNAEALVRLLKGER